MHGFSVLAYAISTLLQLLQSLAIDVTTRGTLGKCIAVRVGEVMTLLKSIGVEISLTRSEAEIDLLCSDVRRSQQKFFSCKSTDATLRHWDLVVIRRHSVA